jgi:ABC-2 type transport system permease protein
VRNEASFPRPAAQPRGHIFAPLRGLVQTGSFIGKEVAEVRRQPKLILSLIAGPFLLLILFGVGYSPKPPLVRTLVVVPPNSEYRAEIERRKEAFGEPFLLEGITSDAAEARRQLENREVGALIFFPEDPYDTIIKGNYAPLLLEFNEIDPFRAQWISYYGYVQTNELNKQLLVEALKQQNSQQHIANLRQSAGAVRDNAAGLRQAVGSGDQGAIAQRAAALEAENARVQTELLTVGQLFGAVAVVGNISQPQETNQGRDLIAAQEASARITQSVGQLRQGGAQGQVSDQQRTLAESIERDAATINESAGRLNLPPAEVVVSPFEPKARDIARLEPSFVNYYAPGVIALLAQHIAVTLSALTLVRERLIGTTEVLRVAPIGVWSIVWGKYLSHFTITALLAAALTAVLHYGLGIPLLGGVQPYALVLGLLIAASLSLGFFISAVASSESQAVQYSLLLLISSVLFGGFFLSLESLIDAVRYGSNILPITHGIIAFQATMLRGEFPPYLALGALAGMAVGLFLLSALLFRRQIRRG